MIQKQSQPALIVGAVIGALVLAGCGPSAGTGTPSSAGSGASGARSSAAPPSVGATQQPDVAGGTTSGDIPDNAVFLTYRSMARGFSIVYVEGWQVTTTSDGVVAKDKDSSETVRVAARPANVSDYVTNTDLPALRAEAGFSLVKSDTVKVNGHSYQHVSYRVLAPPDPVTGKQVPSLVDRYYVLGSSGLAIVSLSTPDGVDNVDAFRAMIASFAWR